MSGKKNTIVGVDESNSKLKQAARLGELEPSMEVIAWCPDTSDAEIIRQTWQEMNPDKEYFVIKDKE